MTECDDYFDLQINGYAGVDFNDGELIGESLHRACVQLRNDGVGGILATVITDTVDRMVARLANLATIREHDPLVRQVVAGVHIEGPFINPEPGYVGAHPVTAVTAADPELMKRLLDAAGGLTRIVTLAPEKDEGLRVTRMLERLGVVVAAGHCNPTIDQLRAAIDVGLSMFTHLGNGCPMRLHRHDNIVQRALGLADRLHISFIADGTHVPFVALRNYLRLIPPEHVVVVSDAISAAGRKPGTYTVGGQAVEVGNDQVPRAADDSHFVGSACIMRQMADNLRRELGASNEQIRQWLSENPRRVIGQNDS
ncbi:MAG: N-acetylglucosamine-6-phosphate deacetylase [Pirellulales bacterium]|nr:N-acetylglucosamine-6-phosphate deacetylase [Pirellulales bacterium]